MRQSQAEVSSLSPAALLAFVLAVERGSFAAAAQRLAVSPAAVGQHVRRLEQSLGVRLLQRTTRRMSLTPEGHRFHERARPLVGELDALGRLFEERDGAIRGLVRITAPSGIARDYVAPIVAQFLAAHPEASVSLDATDALREVGGDGADVAFRVLRPTDSTVVAVRLGRLEATTVASPAYLRAHGTPAHPRELVRHELVGYRHPDGDRLGPFHFRIGGRDVAVSHAARLVVNDVDTGCRAAEAGAGIAQPPSAYVVGATEEGRLTAILEPFRSFPWTLYLCHAGARDLPRRVRAFVDHARATFPRERIVRR